MPLVGVGEGVGLGEGLGVGAGVGLGEGVGDGLGVGDTAPITPLLCEASPPPHPLRAKATETATTLVERKNGRAVVMRFDRPRLD